MLRATGASGIANWTRRFDRLLWVLLLCLLVLVLAEGWLNGVLLQARMSSFGDVAPTTWPRLLKNGLFLALAVAAAAKITMARRWRSFRTDADVALAVLFVVLVVAGLVSGSSPSLIAQAIFVYLRGAIIFYAWRALAPDPVQVRRFVLVLAPLVAVHALAGILQLAVGRQAYLWLGWNDMTWADINRAQGLFKHPNDLGHLLALAALGIAAVLAARPRRPARWWSAFGVVLLGLAATQSRESILAALAGLVVIPLVNGTRKRIVFACAALVVLFAAVPLVITPSNRAEWSRRFDGVVNAVKAPSGSRPTPQPTQSPAPGPTAAATPSQDQASQPAPTQPASTQPAPAEQPSPVTQPAAPPPAEREIRVLYAQQAFDLWRHRPLLGYGTGQFGGYVAYQNNPRWNEDPRFGPNGFDMHGFYTETVDSFWLHLWVETGAIGALAYVGWLFLLIRPLLTASRRARRKSDASGERTLPSPALPWAIATMAVAFLVAFLSISLEDPLFPALLFTVLGIAWTVGLARHAAPDLPRQRVDEADRPLRIGMVIVSEYEANPRVRREAEALAARGDDVTVLALNRAGAPREEMIDGVRVIHLRVSKYRGDSALAYLRLYGAFFVRATAWLIRRPRAFDLVQTHTMPEAMIFTAAAQKLARTPVLLDVHDLTAQLFASKFSPRGLVMRGIQLSTRAAFAFADEVLTVHEPYAETIRAMTKRPLTIVLNSPDERLFPPREHRPPATDGDIVFSYHGLLAPRHGLANLVEAVAQLHREMPRVRLQILGSGDALAALRVQVAEGGLDGIVSLPDGLLPITSIPPALERVHFGVLPSQLDPWTREVLPTKLMEYMALGVPVISFRNRVIVRHFPDDAITFVDPADVANLVAAMRGLASDPERARKQAERASVALVPLQWRQQKVTYLALIDRLARRRSRQPVPGPQAAARTHVGAIPRQREGTHDREGTHQHEGTRQREETTSAAVTTETT
ncbi:glycosyltransferase [Virgisporangium aurantiacum]|uniref:glycosyltransferase n=1 Tax=Virgisporangium aurantiacum TaxID=175570 RepID=UPI00194EF75A|nr:glycosyltransferase [Virgisporangium aurantiacum]